MTRKTYYEKLKDPRWQRKRLEIMQRDDFCCYMCSNTGATLNVHHAFYIKNKDPWEYSNKMLFTLCEECHKELQNDIKKLNYLTSMAGEFSHISTHHYKDLINLFAPFASNKSKIESSCNILINAYFHKTSGKADEIITDFIDRMYKEIGEE